MGLNLKCLGFWVVCVCFFSALCAALPRRLVGDRLVGLVDRTFVWGNARCLACSEGCAFFARGVCGSRSLWSCRGGVGGRSVVPLFVFWIVFLLDLELGFIGKLLVFQWELIVLLLLQICFFFDMRDFMGSLLHGSRADVVEAFGSASRCLGDLLDPTLPPSFPHGGLFYWPI